MKTYILVGSLSLEQKHGIYDEYEFDAWTPRKPGQNLELSFWQLN